MVPKTIDLRSGLLGALMPPQFTAFLRSTPHKSCQRPSSGGPPQLRASRRHLVLRACVLRRWPRPQGRLLMLLGRPGLGSRRAASAPLGWALGRATRGLRGGATGVENRPSLRSSVASSDGAIRVASWARGARPKGRTGPDSRPPEGTHRPRRRGSLLPRPDWSCAGRAQAGGAAG